MPAPSEQFAVLLEDAGVCGYDLSLADAGSVSHVADAASIGGKSSLALRPASDKK